MAAQGFNPSMGGHLRAVLASARMRLLTITRYPGQLGIEILIPIIFASLPILLGRATAGAAAAENFALNTGTTNYAAYMLLGSLTFTIVSFAFWHIAHWVRYEQETGTLEALYLTPTHRLWIASGVSVYSAGRSLFSATLAFILGAIIFNINPFEGDILIAGAFVLVGLIPLFGMAFLFGALIMKVKEANAVMQVMMWGVTLLMGIYFPITLFPPLMRMAALLFPPTWMTNGVRSSMLGLEYFFGTWYWDLAVLWAFLFIAPMLGIWVFTRTENSIRRNQGIGEY